jgi:ribosomal protein L40E/signal transduction histidine kinase
MNRVQDVMNGYFYSKGILRALMNIDFVFYGGGILFLVIGTAFSFVGNIIFYTIGLFAFLAGLVGAVAKKDTWGLIIAFSLFGLLHAVLMVIYFINVFTLNAAMLVYVFSEMITIAIAVLFLILSIHLLPSYQVYKQQRAAVQAAAAQAAAAQAAAAAAYAAAHPQAPYAPPAAPSTVCFSCGFPLAPDAVFCPKCGAKQEKPQKKACANCGSELSPDAVFCVKCGTKVQ